MRPVLARTGKGDLFSRQHLGKHPQPHEQVWVLRLQLWCWAFPLDETSPKGRCSPLPVPEERGGCGAGPGRVRGGCGGDGR